MEQRLEGKEFATLDPSKQLCPIYDATSILEFPVAPYGEMGVRVVDNCCEEHIM